MTLAHYVVSTGAAAALLVGCGGSQPISAPGALPHTPGIAPARMTAHRIGNASSSYHVLYRFGGVPDGVTPAASLVDVSGTLYGTTEYGGSAHGPKYSYGTGTVFSISTTGGEHVLYRFGRRPDGNRSDAGLIDLDGTLYGTTQSGGKHGRGTVFSISTTGQELVLHSFRGGSSDGERPSANLVNVNGTLYGTTPGGGTYGQGTVFGITASGSERVIYSFTGGADGREPDGSLLNVSGTLYGTTYFGGQYGNGTIFNVSTTGQEQLLYSFGRSSSDGLLPNTDLIEVNGELYGTTSGGGTYHKGTVFSLTLSGAEKVLYSFRGRDDGAGPVAGLVAVNHLLYGTTVGGGSHWVRRAYGTIFSINTTGEEQVLHHFGRGSDGAYPEATLIDVNGTLYGTTTSGGGTSSQCPQRYSTGCGTVFALTP